MATKHLRAAQIAALKYKARIHYEGYQRELDAYDCGSVLAETINPRLADHKREFNKIMDELVQIDPEAPTFRL